MKKEHEYAQVLRWIADGEAVQTYDYLISEWIDRHSTALLRDIFNQETAPENFRIKPRTILINGIEVPEPLISAPKVGISYCYLSLGHREHSVYESRWNDDIADHRILKRGLIHLTKEAAETHARALLSFTEVRE